MFGLFTRKKSFADKAELLFKYTFPKVVIKRFEDNFPGKYEEAESGLKLFFLLILWNDENRFIGTVEMYNKTADELWHTFLLDTNGYQEFCKEVFGRFIHHNPYETEKELNNYFPVAKVNLIKALNNLKYENPYLFNIFYDYSLVDGKFDMKDQFVAKLKKPSSSSRSTDSYSSNRDNYIADNTWMDSISSVFSSSSSTSSTKSSCSSSSKSSCGSSCSSGSSCGGGGCGS